jgi:hypothetical protein
MPFLSAKRRGEDRSLDLFGDTDAIPNGRWECGLLPGRREESITIQGTGPGPPSSGVAIFGCSLVAASQIWRDCA